MTTTRGFATESATCFRKKNGRLSFFYTESREKGEKILSEHEEISLAIIDLNLNGGGDGLCALKAFRKIRADLAAIVFTMYADPLHIESALRAGVQGYITKDAEIEELESAILAVAAGGNCFNKAAQKIIQSLLSPESAKTEDFSYMNYKSLTKAEQEVFALLAQKKEVGEIARILRKKEKTVQNQKSLICQ